METMPLNIAMPIICLLGILCFILLIAWDSARDRADAAQKDEKRLMERHLRTLKDLESLDWDHESLLAFLDDNDIMVSRYEPRPDPKWVLKFRGGEEV